MGPAASKLAAAMLRGSQGCSALQPPAAALVWPSATPPQRWAAQRSFFFGPSSSAAEFRE
ncbi:hypothetical protein SGRA_1069 [Saprospira grandis str. Lewin]|uniref:Uncharacterized protein n=1 Tax=Saprospira grandis (strain Lewin) TaxID=984262 RepID=H6L3F7_SAPGL|nr:hypothetical protein SGRA_1069 [Saprospira grandis str. Lewin]